MEGDSPLRPVSGLWLEKIRVALDHKARRFSKDAEEGMRFFVGGTYDWLYAGRAGDRHFRAGDDVESPTFQMTLNKTAELVQLFGPVLYHRNPVRTVTPRKQPAVPPEAFAAAAQQSPEAVAAYRQLVAQLEQSRATDRGRAAVMAAYLNHTPTALDLKRECRWAIDEALIKGMGLLWTETYDPPGGGFRMVGSFFDSVDHLVIDPDMESLADAKWVARRCCHPAWQVERDYGLPPGSLKANGESSAAAATAAATGDDWNRRTGRTADLLTYWKVYSKMGAGGRLAGIDRQAVAGLDGFGDYCMVAVCDSCPHPLNLPPPVTDAGPEAIRQALQWPTPFWADGGWPFAPLAFHWVPRDVWPMSHLAPAMGELKFLNWMYSFVAGKIRTTCRDFLAVPKDLDEEVKRAILGGKDLTLLELEREHADAFARIIQVFQHAPMNGDVWRVVQAVADQFDRRTGLTELMYGQSARQFRSAAEATQKFDQLNVRPDDMANSVEDAMTQAARNEALAARWHLEPADVAPVLGPLGAQFWADTIYVADPATVLHSLEYRIEAGSARKPNRAAAAENMQAAMQNVFQPLLQACAAAGTMGPVNAFLREWGRTLDLDVEQAGIVFPDLPPPMPPQGPPPEGGPPGQPQPQGA
jgi:hypothetical protein